MEMAKADEEVEVKKSNTCEECGASFKTPAYLKQQMLSHSLEESKCVGLRKALDPTKELQNARRFGLEWTSTRGETSCEAPSSDPQSRSVTIKDLELLRTIVSTV